jgi:hypothetical protein
MVTQMADELENLKRRQEVLDRPIPTATLPPELQHHEFSKVSYAAPKKEKPKSSPKGETEKSLDWNEQQRKVVEPQ